MIINQTVSGGGSTPVIDTLNVTPTTSAQTITAPSGTDGYSPVNVSAVTSAIDANIQSGNIKSGVTILGTTGSVVELQGSTETVTPTTSQQTITPTSPSNGLTSVTVNAVTSSIDNNIQAGNIKDGVTILGVTGSYTGGGSSGPKVPLQIDNGALYPGPTGIDVGGAQNIASQYLFYRTYYYSSRQTSGSAFLNSTNLTTISGTSCLEECFNRCQNITSTGLDNVQEITGTNALKSCFTGTSITSTGLGNLTSATGTSCLQGTFQECNNLTSAGINWNNLTIVAGTTLGSSPFYLTFSTCSGLTDTGFGNGIPSCTGDYIFYNTFFHCNSLTSTGFNFPANTIISNKGMFYGAFNTCEGLTDAHLDNVKELNGTYEFFQCFADCVSLQRTGLSNLTNVSGYSFRGAFSGSGLVDTGIDFSKITMTGDNCFNSAFSNCGSLEKTGFESSEPYVLTINGSSVFGACFSYCYNLTKTDMDNIFVIVGAISPSSASYGSMYQMYRTTTGLTDFGLSGLCQASGRYLFSSMFQNSGLTSASFTNLSKAASNNMFQQMFSGCTSLQTLSFPNLDATALYVNTTFTNMLQGCTGVTVHFPQNAQSVIGSWATVTGGFGGTNTTVLFDLPNPNIAYVTGRPNDKIYRAPSFDTSSYLAWYWGDNNELRYTAGTSLPSVGDTMYSDKTLTNSWGTIDTIS